MLWSVDFLSGFAFNLPTVLFIRILTTVHMVLAIDVCYWYVHPVRGYPVSQVVVLRYMVSKFGDLEAVMAIYPWYFKCIPLVHSR